MGQEEQTFRIILLIGILIVIPVLRFYRHRARASGERLNRRAEGALILLTLRPFALAAFLSLVVYVINPEWMAWSSMELPLWVRWVGVLGAAISASSLCIVLVHLGKNLTDTVVTRANHTLVTEGPYGWVRHPFYSAIALGLASNALVTANWFLGLTGLCAMVLIVIRTSIEEAKLIERFGDQYRSYMERTGRFCPRLLRSRSSSVGGQMPHAFSAKPAIVKSRA